MEEIMKDKLNEAGAEVFGMMYFMPIQVLDSVPDENSWNLDKSYVSAEIAFSGSLNAVITFYFPGEMAKHIVEGFLGVDPEDISTQQMLDTMKEAVNMMVGCFLGKVDPEGASQLGIPDASLVQDFSPNNISNDAMVVFQSEFGYLWMSYV